MKLKPVTSIRFLLCLAAVPLAAQPILYFNGSNGSNPQSAPIQAANGALYGVTAGGGAFNQGTVFKIGGSTLTTLYSFCSESGCGDGAVPAGGLVQAANGDLYGTTRGFEGPRNSFTSTIFKITPAGSFTSLGALNDDGSGIEIRGSLIQAANGDIWGTAALGGLHREGTIFKITPGGAFTVVHAFCSLPACADGSQPVAGLVQGPSGDLFGTTQSGGSPESNTAGGTGFGTIFRITPGGQLTTIHTFCLRGGCQDGSGPRGSLVMAADGNIYGLTETGGAGDGTVFKVTPGGTFTTLHNFAGPEGALPNALIQGSDGNLYGTTTSGGGNSLGEVFKMTLDGTVTALFSANRSVGLLTGLGQDTAGKFFVSGTFGWYRDGGTILVLDEGLGPFVETLPDFGAAGTAVRILGTGLTGTTSVSFNGTEAVFEVVSGSEITTTVPAGASSGTIQVVTPGGALSSNEPFRVR